MKIIDVVRTCDATLPHFPDGRIDYTTAERCPVINIIVFSEGDVLLLKRSEAVLAYKGKWNSIGGYLDEVRPVQDKVYEELREELSITPSQIQSMGFLEPIEVVDNAINRTWLIQPVFAVLKDRPEIILDFEHTEYAWVQPNRVREFDAVKGLDSLVEAAAIRAL